MIKTMGGGYLRFWQEDGFVYVATAPAGRNEYVVQLWTDDAMRALAEFSRSIREADDGVDPTQ